MPIRLLATLHSDREEGPGRLHAQYAAIKPRVVVSETSEQEIAALGRAACETFNRLRAYTCKESELGQLVEYVFRPKWEYETNQQYSAKTGARHILIDIWDAAREHDLQEQVELLVDSVDAYAQVASIASRIRPSLGSREYDPLAALARLRASNRKENQLRRNQLAALLCVDRPELNDAFLSANPAWYQRDKDWERVLRSLDPSLEVAFPVGGSHALSSPQYQTIYTRLRDLAPVRILL